MTGAGALLWLRLSRAMSLAAVLLAPLLLIVGTRPAPAPPREPDARGPARVAPLLPDGARAARRRRGGVWGPSGPEGQPAPRRALVVDLGRAAHRFRGFGLAIHPSDVRHHELLRELDVDLLRLEVGPNWNDIGQPIPTEDRQALDRFVARYFDGDSPQRLSGAQWAFEVSRRLGVETSLVIYELPHQWLDVGFWRELHDHRVDDLARFWAALLVFLRRHGVVPDYLELCNEPDGNWNGHLPPARYARLVKATRVELDRRGLQSVKLLGPGLAFMRRERVASRWLDALDPDAVGCLWGWSTHCWDEVDFRAARPEFTHGVWQEFIDAARGKDPTKEIFVTEYATEITRYGGRTVPSPRTGAAFSASDTVPFAVRVVANSLVHVNRGASALVIYRLADHPWHRTSWGIFRKPELGGGPRPALGALRAVLPHVPDGAEVLESVWHATDDDQLQIAAFRAGDRVTLVFANCGPTSVSRRLVLRGAERARLRLQRGFPAVGEPVRFDGARAWVSVASQHVLTLVVEVSG